MAIQGSNLMVPRPTSQVPDVFRATELCPKTLPTEIILKIIALLGPNELFSFACTNSIFRVEAERALYQSIRPYYSTKTLVKCLETLKSFKHKALLVKSFFLWIPSALDISKALIQSVCDCLWLMSSLTCLQLCLPPQCPEYVSMMLGPRLRHCIFHLTSLYLSLPYEILLASWVPYQTKLKCLIINGQSDHPTSLLSNFQQLHNQLPDCETFFCLRQSYLHAINRLAAFPAFSQQWSAGRIKELMYDFFGYPENITCFTIYINTLSDHKRLREIVLSIGEHFPQTRDVVFHIQDPQVDVNPETLASILSLLPELEKLDLRNWGQNSITPHSSYGKCRTELTTIWSSQSPKMRRVGFPDITYCLYGMNGTWNIYKWY